MNSAWLIAVDGSAASLNAVHYAIKEAASRTDKPQFFVINVQAPLSGDITRFVDSQTVEDFHREAGEAALTQAKEKLGAAGLDYSAHILIGDAAPTIVGFAVDRDCSLIVVGAQGAGSVVGLFMGSVALKVVHLWARPVLLVR